jgi:glycosyltransferase involved in cell wall biosynthesis
VVPLTAGKQKGYPPPNCQKIPLIGKINPSVQLNCKRQTSPPALSLKYEAVPGGLVLISIIIPTDNDTDIIAGALAQLSEQSGEFEIIIVDGGETDNALSLVEGRARVVSAPGLPRGSRLNVGAAAARGDILLFLWPDSYLPANALAAIERNLELLPQTIGGNFHLKFDKDTLFTRWLARWLKQQRYQGHYEGNSGIFIRREAFQTLGGFRPYDILADYDLARRMEDYGPTLYLPETVIVSSRKFQGRPLKLAFTWLLIHSLFTLGVHPNRLARWYWL